MEKGYYLWIDGRGYGQFSSLSELFDVLDTHHREYSDQFDRYFLWEIEDFSNGYDVAPVRRAAERIPVIAWNSYDWDAERFEAWLDVFGWDQANNAY